MFDENSFEMRIKLVYLDIPRLHEFTEEGNRFFELLELTEDIELFKKESVQILITYKWGIVFDFIFYQQFLPHVAQVLIHLYWNVHIRPYRSEIPAWNGAFVAVLLLF